MADEPLRMQAEVVDKFTGPLKAFRQHLLDAARSGADHSETLTKGFGKVEGALQGTARTAQTVLNPALSALGVTGLGVGVAVAGIAGALRNLSGNLTALGQLSRETGVAADTLRVFGSVASKFNVDQDTMAAGTKNFVANLREFRMHGNETFAWLQSQGRTTEGRSAFQNLAKDLRNSTDAGEALKKALQFGEQIKDPTERGIFFQKLFGNADLARVADGHLGKLEDVWKKTTERLPPLDPKAILKAEEFERSVADLRGSMKSIGTTIASEVLPFASDFTKWIDDIVKDQRGDFMKGLREGLKEVSAELRGVDWKSAGDGAKEMLVGTTALVGTLAKGLKDVADTVRFLREGEYWQALRQEGGNGALARKLAPRLGDDEIAAQEEVDKARKLRDAAKEAGEHLIGRTQQRMGLLVDPEKAQRDLDAAEARLKGLKERTPEDRKRDFDASEKLRRSMDGLTDELKAQRQGKDAQVSKSSADADGVFGGARIQAASFGGGGGYQRYGGGSGPGYVGEAGPAGPSAGRSYGGGRLNGLGDGGAPSPRMPGIGGGSAGSAPSEPPSGYSGNDGRRAARSGMTAAGRQNVASWMEFFRRPVDQGGMGYSEEQARGQIAMMQGESGLNLNPAAKGDKDRAGTPHAFGTVQWSDAKGNQRFPRLRALAAEMGKDWTDRGVQQEMYRREMMGAYRGVYNRIRGAQTGEQSLWTGITGYENPREHSLAYSIRRPFLDRLRRDGAPGAGAGQSDGDFLPNGTPRVLKPDSMRGAPGLTMSESDRMRAGRADGDAWAAREKARKEFDRRLQSGDERLTASASRAGVGGGKLEANGSVYVQVHRPGPETQVSTSASGNLFRDVQMRRGQAMEKAGGG